MEHLKGNNLFTFIPFDSTQTTPIYTGTGLPLILANDLITIGTQEQSATVFEVRKIPNPDSYFSSTQLVFLILGIIFSFSSILLFQFQFPKGKYAQPLILLIIGTLLLRVFAILLDDHLNTWDEQFHALVAKNIWSHPLQPTLIDHPILHYDYKSWIGNHIWLHKQPLFLWEIGLYLKVFGTNLIGLRAHSVVISGVLAFLIFRMGSKLISVKIGFYAAFLFACANFALELASGYFHTDHNDISFLFYVTLSLWAWIEYSYEQNKNRKLVFLFLIGSFAGAAALTKWLMGFLVYLGWFIQIVSKKGDHKSKLPEFGKLHITFSFTLLLFLPWQIYSRMKYPMESTWELALNQRHFFEVIENHSGTWMFHLEPTLLLYKLPSLLFLFILPILWKFIHSRENRNSIIGLLVFVYVFFSIAQTKMPGFTFFLAPFVFIGLAQIIDLFFNPLIINKNVYKNPKTPYIYRSLIFGLLFFYFLDIEKFQFIHSSWNKQNDQEWIAKQEHHLMIRTLNARSPNIENYVLFNLKEYGHIRSLFHSSAVSAYGQVPSPEEIGIVFEKGFEVAVFDDGNLPVYIHENDRILKFNVKPKMERSIFIDG